VRRLCGVRDDRVGAELPERPRQADRPNSSRWRHRCHGPRCELLAKIRADLAKALELPETRQFFKTNSFERVDLSPQDFGKLIQGDLRHWSALINAVGAKID
jgi:hypothetical protein